jgi:zinc protease
MKRILGSVFVIALFVTAGFSQKPDSSAAPVAKPVSNPVKLPAAKEVVDKYVKAIGGRDALLKHKSRYQTGTIELSPMGVKGTIESFSRSDNRALTKISLAGIGDILDGYDGTTAWTANPVQGNRVKEGKELEQAKRLNNFGREANLEKIYTSLTVKNVEKVGDRDAYVVVASTEGLPDDILYFDTETGLMLRSDSIVLAPEGQQATSSFYEDYREVNGIKSAHKIRAKTPAFEIITAVTEIKYDVTIEDSKFVQPK